jgi:putative polyketide hydroxylase
MEIFRQWGIDELVRQAGLSPEANGFFFRGASLLAEHFERSGGGGLVADARSLSPETWMVISQDVLEPVMLNAARAADMASVRFGNELVSLETDPEGALALVRDRANDRLLTIRARWVIGADGADSYVRAIAGITLQGHGPLVDNVSILFESPLGALIDDRRSAVYYLTNKPTSRPRGYPMSVGNPPDDGVLLTVDNAERWLLVVADDIAKVDEASAIRRIHRAIGRTDLPVRIVGFMPWSPAALVAERYSEGGLFLAGDAAHQMTPSGAFGLNVGIADAHNLAWKLSSVDAGWADASILGSYNAERRPVGLFATDQSYQQFLGTRPARPFGNWGVILGANYASSCVLPDGSSPATLVDPAVDYVPEAHPGARAPHGWLLVDGRRCSTLDLYGRGFTLIVGSKAIGWRTDGTRAAATLGVPFTTFQLSVDGVAEDPVAFATEHAIGDFGAILVRPDGHVSWRTPGMWMANGVGLEYVLRHVVGSLPAISQT